MAEKRREESPESFVEDRKRLKLKDPYVNIGNSIDRWNEYREKLNVNSDEKLAETLLDRLSKGSDTSTPANADLDRNRTGTSSSDFIKFTDSAGSELSCVPKETHALPDDRYAADFEEIGRLGKGGFGAVFKSKNKLDGITYAVKKIRFLNSKPEDLKKVQREVTALAKLKHSNIVRYNTSWLVNDKRPIITTVSGTSLSSWESSIGNGGVLASFESNNENDDESCIQDESQSNQARGGALSHKKSGSVASRKARKQTPSSSKNQKKAVVLYIQMELCSQTLMEWMHIRTDVKLTDNMSISEQVLKAVNYMHCEGVIHRDLKPKNIFLMEGLHIKVGDFGLAKEDMVSAIAASPAHSEPSPADSMTGSIHSDHTSGIGTKIYAAPEQLDGCTYDFKCDIYSLGVIFFELFNIFGTEMERRISLEEFRKGKVPDKFRNDWPIQTELILGMTSDSPEERPSAIEILSGEMFTEIDKPETLNTTTKDSKEIEELRREIERLKLDIKQKDELLKQKDKKLLRLSSMEV